MSEMQAPRESFQKRGRQSSVTHSSTYSLDKIRSLHERASHGLSHSDAVLIFTLSKFKVLLISGSRNLQVPCIN